MPKGSQCPRWSPHCLQWWPVCLGGQDKTRNLLRVLERYLDHHHHHHVLSFTLQGGVFDLSVSRYAADCPKFRLLLAEQHAAASSAPQAVGLQPAAPPSPTMGEGGGLSFDVAVPSSVPSYSAAAPVLFHVAEWPTHDGKMTVGGEHDSRVAE